MLRLSLGNVSKYGFFTGKDVLPEETRPTKSCYNKKDLNIRL